MDPVAAPRGSLEPPPSPPLCSIPQTIVKRSGNDSARNNLPANECLKRNCSIADGSFINFDRRYLIEAARRGEARCFYAFRSVWEREGWYTDASKKIYQVDVFR